MSNNCNIDIALREINNLKSLVNDINEKGNLNKLTSSSLDNMVNNILGNNATELKGYQYINQARSKELKSLEESIENLSSESPLFSIVSKRYKDNDVDSTQYYRTLNTNQGIDVRSVIGIAEPNVINSVDLNGAFPKQTVRLLEQTSEALEAALEHVSSGSKDSIRPSDRERNPAFNFLSTRNNSPNMLAALRSSVDNYLLENYVDLTTQPEDILEMLSLPAENLTPANISLINRFQNGGSLASVEAHKLGQNIASTLGIKPAKNGNTEDYNALVSGFGQVGLMLMAKLGYIKPYEAPKREHNRTPLEDEQLEGTGKFIKELHSGNKVIDTGVFISDDLDVTALEEIKKAVDPLNEFIEKETETVLPSFERSNTNYSNLGKKRQEFVKVTKPAAKAIEYLENIEYTVESSSLDRMLKAFGVIDDVNSIEADAIDGIVDTLLKDSDFRRSVGIKDLKDGQGKDIPYSRNKRESIAAVNKSIEDKLRGVLLVKAEQNKNNNKGFFYRWFVARNDRLHMKNTVASPQDDKLFARWFILPSNIKADINTSDIEKSLNDPEEQYDEKVDNLLYGIVQSFDGVKNLEFKVPDTEKVTRRETIEAARKLINLGEAQLNSAAKQAEHIGHAFLAVDNISNLNEVLNSGSNTFTTSMVREVDGKTNGFGHKMLQFPIGNYKKLLSSVGIFTEDTKFIVDEEGNEKEITSAAEKTANKEVADVYQQVAFNMLQHFKVFAGNASSSINKFISNIANDDYGFSSIDAATASDIDGTLRAFTKTPSTHVMYSSLAYNAGKKKSKVITEDILDKFTRSENLSQNLRELSNTMKAVAKEDAALAKAFKDNDKLPAPRFKGSDRKFLFEKANRLAEIASNPERAESLRKSLINDYVDQGNNKGLYRSVELVTDFYYGRSLENGLKDMFGVHEDLMNDINSGMQFVFDVFKRMYAFKKLEILESTGVFTKEDQNKVINELSDVVPGIRVVDASDKSEKVLFIKPKPGIRDELHDIEKDHLGRVTEIRAKLTDAGNINNQGGEPRMSYINYERHFKVDIMVDTFDEPGASGLPVSTHSLDAANLVRTLNEASKKGASVLPLHDATVYGSGDTSTNKTLNSTFFDANSEFSIMSNLMENILQAYEFAGTYIVNTKEPIYGIGREKKSADTVVRSLRVQSDIINKTRKELFDQPMLIGQFVGEKGSMYQSSPTKTDDRKNNSLYIDNDSTDQDTSVERTTNENNVDSSIDDQLRLELEIAAKYCK